MDLFASSSVIATVFELILQLNCNRCLALDTFYNAKSSMTTWEQCVLMDSFAGVQASHLFLAPNHFGTRIPSALRLRPNKFP